MNYKTNKAQRLPFPVSSICFGTSPLGSMPDTYGYEVSETRARETIEAIFELDHSFIDTSRNYGMGRSEERLGVAIRANGGLPDNCVLATKLDRDFETNSLDAVRVRRSFEESLEALGVDRLQILHLHDPEHCADLSEITCKGGAIDEMFRLKEEGLVDAVGLAMGDIDLMGKILPDWEFDALINHNRYTLLNRSANALYDAAHARGIAIFNAAPYAGGALAKGAATGRLTYQEANEEQLAPVRAVEDICQKYQVPMGAAALQFSMRDARVTSTICGVSKPERLSQTLDWAQCEIQQEMWQALDALPYGMDNPEANREYKPC